jgi:hypothetical protein
VDNPGTTKPLAVIIIGADALLDARPATPIQLWHGCLAVGYDLAIPATWGDELVAAECLRGVASHPQQVTVLCSCPLVARAVGGVQNEITPHLISLVAPPVATARYVRRVHGDRRIHITFVGACPSGADSAIDAWLTPGELLDRFAAAGIVLGQQPELFESVLPPDRRRHLSQPGGLPASERVAAMRGAPLVHEIDDSDVVGALHRHLEGPVRMLLDLAPRVGCACSGASAGVPPREARAAVTVLEPPRSARPVMPDPGGLGLARRLPTRQWTVPDAGAAPAARDVRRRGEPVAQGPTAVTNPSMHSPLSWNVDAETAAAARALEAASASAKVHPVASPMVPQIAVAAAERREMTPERAETPAGAATDPVTPPRRAPPPASSRAVAPAPAPTAPGNYWFVPPTAVATPPGVAVQAPAPPSPRGARLTERELQLIAEGEALAADVAMSAAEDRALALAAPTNGRSTTRSVLAEPRRESGTPSAAAGVIRSPVDWEAFRERATALRGTLRRPGHGTVIIAALLLVLVIMIAIGIGADDQERPPPDSSSSPSAASDVPGVAERIPTESDRAAGGAGGPAAARSTGGETASDLPPGDRPGSGEHSPAAVSAATPSVSAPLPVTPAPPPPASIDTALPAGTRASTPRDSAVGDSLRADSIARSTAAAMDAELAAIRAELLRRQARLDSIEAAISRPLVPRPTVTRPPASPPVRTPPPPRGLR